MAGRWTIVPLVLLFGGTAMGQDQTSNQVPNQTPSQASPSQQLNQAPNQASQPPEFHGTYEELKPAQKQLIDEWYADYNRMTGDHADPKEYNQFSLSTRTTYEAVTHALMTTQLTDKSGKPMGTALDLVQEIEAINGKVTRARGDLQFRMYVQLKPDALQKLKDSSEFFRDRDNTVYHSGYPLNYRQAGTPSIQFSMAKDGQHADIDVDYRSSGFPAGPVQWPLDGVEFGCAGGKQHAGTPATLARADGLVAQSVWTSGSGGRSERRFAAGGCASHTAQGGWEARRCDAGFSAVVAGGAEARVLGVVLVAAIVFLP